MIATRARFHQFQPDENNGHTTSASPSPNQAPRLIVNTTPANPYFVATLQTWVQGKFLNFNGAAQFLSLLWPFFAFWYLLLPSHRRAAH